MICLILIAPITPYIDLSLATYFNNLHPFTSQAAREIPFFFNVYNYGERPAFVAAGLAMLILVSSYVFKPWKKLRKPCLVLVLTMIVGAGIITNAILKDHWGRPRPRQITELGGTLPFLPFYQPDFHIMDQSRKSFPSGHSVMGFYFLTFAILGNRLHSKWMTWFGIIVGLGAGITLGITRMAQGGHFFSDVLFAGLLMWWTALSMDWLVYHGE